MHAILERLEEAFHTPFNDAVLIFGLLLLIVLIAPLVLRRIGLPGIIGLILCGVLVGPHGLRIIEKSVAVDLFATVGLLYIMFIAGLELDLEEFKRKRHKSGIFGALTFIFPLAIGFPVCYYLLGYGFETSLLTAGMFSTHTLVAYPIVSRLGIVKHETVALTVGGTIITDTAVLLMFPIVTASAYGRTIWEVWQGLLITGPIFLFFAFYVAPKIANWFFRFAGSDPYAQYIFVLSVVFLTAFFAELAGLEPIIGAFAAGLALNRLIPHTSPLMNRIEFVGNALFIPFFLISVGMIINLGVLTRGPQALIVAGALTTVALFGKWIAAWITSRVFRYTSIERNLIFGLSSSHAAATLAIILVGFNLGIIDENILNGTVLLILVTCVVASFVTEYYGKKIALYEAEKAPVLPVHAAEKLLVPIAYPDNMEQLIDLALMLKRPKSAAPVTGLSVVIDDAEAKNRLSQARKTLDKALVHAASAGQTIEIISTIDQNVPSGIRRVAMEIDATDIILGHSPQNNLSQLIFGKTTQQVVEMTTQGVWVCRLTHPYHQVGKIRLFCPPLCEMEYGFSQWVEKVARLSAALGKTLVCYGVEKTFRQIEDFLQVQKIGGSVEYHAFEEWKIFEEITASFQPTDLIALVSPREGAISHRPVLERLSRHLDSYLPDSSFLIIHPSVNPDSPDESLYDVYI